MTDEQRVNRKILEEIGLIPRRMTALRLLKVGAIMVLGHTLRWVTVGFLLVQGARLAGVNL